MPLLVLAVLVMAPAARPSSASSVAGAADPIKHVVVIVQENHTFDNYFGTFPGANGIQNDPPTVHPFHLNGTAPDMCHSTDCAHFAYDNGTMDRFVQAEGSNDTFGYYDQSDLPYYWALAKNYTLFDDYFTAVMGPSLPNHLYLVSAQDAGIADSIRNQTTNLDIGSIANELQAANDSWAYYSPYVVGNENALGLVSSVVGNGKMMADLKYTSQFVTDVKSGNMPDVAYVTADDGFNEHPPFNISVGAAWVKSVISTIQASPYWGSTVILLTWDDYGGWYDHVVPPQVDKYGDGFRVPLLMVSPLAKHGFVDHTFSDHTSIMKFIERVFGLPAVTERDASAADLLEALNPASTDIASRFADDSLLVQGTPTYLDVAPRAHSNLVDPSLSVSFLNDLNHEQSAVFYAAIRNELNQTLQIVTVKATLAPGAVAQVPFFLDGRPPGPYSIEILATAPRGNPLSEPLTLLLNAQQPA